MIKVSVAWKTVFDSLSMDIGEICNKDKGLGHFLIGGFDVKHARRIGNGHFIKGFCDVLWATSVDRIMRDYHERNRCEREMRCDLEFQQDLSRLTLYYELVFFSLKKLYKDLHKHHDMLLKFAQMKTTDAEYAERKMELVTLLHLKEITRTDDGFEVLPSVLSCMRVLTRTEISGEYTNLISELNDAAPNSKLIKAYVGNIQKNCRCVAVYVSVASPSLVAFSGAADCQGEKDDYAAYAKINAKINVTNKGYKYDEDDTTNEKIKKMVGNLKDAYNGWNAICRICKKMNLFITPTNGNVLRYKSYQLECTFKESLHDCLQDVSVESEVPKDITHDFACCERKILSKEDLDSGGTMLIKFAPCVQCHHAIEDKKTQIPFEVIHSLVDCSLLSKDVKLLHGSRF